MDLSKLLSLLATLKIRKFGIFLPSWNFTFFEFCPKKDPARLLCWRRRLLDKKNEVLLYKQTK